VARIQDGDDGPGHISIRLSGSSATVRLDAIVGALIDEDVDHDGDLDLVAATASGDVLIWLNDGHGRFTRQEPTRPQGFTTESVIGNPESNEPVAVSLRASFIAPGKGEETAVVVIHARPPTAPRVFNLSFLLLQALRAPPSVAV
jgi:hypothetical protein